jgi:TAZ zinc finger
MTSTTNCSDGGKCKENMSTMDQSNNCTNKENCVNSNNTAAKLPTRTKSQLPNIVNNETKNKILFRRIEEIIAIWYHKVTNEIKMCQAQPLSIRTEEKKSILKYCGNILHRTLMSGNIQNIITYNNHPMLVHKQFPSLQDLPCMVATIQHWYCHYVRLRHHQKVVEYVFGRFLTPRQRGCMTTAEYMYACENKVLQWIGIIAGTESKSITLDQDKPLIDGNNASEECADVMEDQETVHNNSAPSFTMIQPNNVHCHESLGDGTISVTNTTGAMADSTASAESTSTGGSKSVLCGRVLSDKTSIANTKPTARPVVAIMDVTTAVHSDAVQEKNSSNPNDKINRYRGMILTMYHAVKCPFNDPSSTYSHRRCPIYSGCCAIKKLQRHISDSWDINTNNKDASGTSQQCNCTFGILCREARESVQHYAQCKSELCPICGPVIRHLPKMKEEIRDAVDVSIREVGEVSTAQCTVMDEIIAVSQTETGATVLSKPSYMKRKSYVLTNSNIIDSYPSASKYQQHGPPKKRFCHE